MKNLLYLGTTPATRRSLSAALRGHRRVIAGETLPAEVLRVAAQTVYAVDFRLFRENAVFVFVPEN